MSAPTLFAHSIFTFPHIKENVYKMVEDRAKGGSAAVSTGELSVNAEEAECLFLDRSIDFEDYTSQEFKAIKEYSDRIKKHGALSFLEFCHEGAHSEAKPPHQPWGPMNYVREDGVEVLAMDEAMMEKVCKDFYNIARYAREAGFDGVLCHGGHGFIIQQFVSTWTNKRTDEYGGSMENRARFPIEILKAVREGAGEDMIFELRLSAEDVDGDMTIDDTVEFCKLIDGLVDTIHVSNGLKWAGQRTHTFSSFFDIHGINVDHARKIKEVVKKSKVAVIGGINSPDLAEEIIASGAADLVQLGRQGFADPEFANKAKEGREDEIRRCTRCFNCYPGFSEHETDVPLEERLPAEEVQRIYSPTSMGVCTVNPNSGFGHNEADYPMPKEARRVLVVGGGPGGLEGALTAAKRGHKVLLIEKLDKLGGILKLCDIDHDKEDLGAYKDLQIRELKKRDNVEIRLECPLSKEILDDFKPDKVLVAVGADPLVPGIKGIDTAVQALDVYFGDQAIGQNVILVGGGLVGCEVGLHLAAEGKKVSVVEMNEMMAPETFGYYRNALMEEMDDRDMVQYTGTKCLEIFEDGVLVERNGQEERLYADTVIFSMGMRPNQAKIGEIEDILRGYDYELVGDCKEVGKVVDAIHDSYRRALEIV